MKTTGLKTFWMALALLLATTSAAQNKIVRRTTSTTSTSTTTTTTTTTPASPQKRKVKPQKVTPPRTTTSASTLTYTVNGVSFKMVRVEGGTFQMGSNDGEDDEKPVHSVTLSSYHIGQTEVTQELWQAVMGSNPSYFKGSNCPVEMVSWNECLVFITKLNELTGETFRLLTEAEWEYAARGGNKSQGYTYSGSNSLGSVAWYGYNSGDETHPVATKTPNELDIYDMSGNVYEWCQDSYDSNYYSYSPANNPIGPSSDSLRVARGGSWLNFVTHCRVAFRNNAGSTKANNALGLRLAL